MSRGRLAATACTAAAAAADFAVAVAPADVVCSFLFFSFFLFFSRSFGLLRVACVGEVFLVFISSVQGTAKKKDPKNISYVRTYAYPKKQSFFFFHPPHVVTL